jgi:hypothetical protein
MIRQTFHRVLVMGAMLATMATATWAAELSTGFRYQGRLTEGGHPASGTYELRFDLCTNAVEGTNVTSPLLRTNVAVLNGLFATDLDFGAGIWDGTAYWLEIGVRTNGSTASFTTLSPRCRLSAVPYSLYTAQAGVSASASNLLAALPGGLLSGTYFSRVVLNNPSNSFAGDGSGLTNLNTWQSTGNSGTTAGVNFLGTTDNQPMELAVNGQRVLRLEPTLISPNVIGGFSGNYASNAVGVTIGGGGASGKPNAVLADYGAIGGGYCNAILTNSPFATVSGGQFNSASGANVTAGGGLSNTIVAVNSTIGGGIQNKITPYSLGNDSSGQINNTIGGGGINAISGGVSHDSAIGHTIAGGLGNGVGRRSSCNSIGGGSQNKINFENSSSTIAGGANNFVDGSGATVAGGTDNKIAWAGPSFNHSIGGGGANYIQSAYSGCTIGGGYGNSCLGGLGYSTISGGIGNTNNGSSATIGGGFSNVVVAKYAVVPGGAQAKAACQGQMALASGQFASVGDAQTSVYVCRGTTTDGTLTDLFLDGSGQSARMAMPANSTWGFDILVTGRASGGNSAVYQFRGMVKNNAGTITLTSTKTLLAEDVASWDATVVADDTYDALVVRVAGAAATNIRWVASVRTVEVTY